MKHWHWIAAAYAVAGLATVAWTASLGAANKPHYESGTSGAQGLLTAFVVWPYAAYKNATA